MLDIEVIEDPAAAEASLDPIRTRILSELAEPGSATQLAAKVGLPRQKVNYHLKALERHGLVELVEERRRGNVTERILRATAASYLISPAALASVAPDPHRFSDRFSAFWLLALAARMVQEMGQLIAGAAAAKQKLATFAIDGEITFRSAADRPAFAEELGVAVTRLVDKYHDGGRDLPEADRPAGSPAGSPVGPPPAGRKHRLVIALHPSLKAPAPEAAHSDPHATTNSQPTGRTYTPRSRTMTDKRKFEIVYDTELPVTPERAWEAVTKDTPAWMFPTDQWPAVRTVDEYPSHLVSRMDGPDGWFNQLEHVLEPLDGGRARLHYVHSGIFADNWDEQYDGASKHTAFYLHTLGQYLRYFDGKPVVFTDIQALAASQTPDGFDRLRKALGVDAAAQGQTVEPELDGVGPLRRRNRLLQRELPRPAHCGHDVPLLRAQRLRRTGGHDRARLQRQRGHRGDGEGLGRVPGEGLRLTRRPAFSPARH